MATPTPEKRIDEALAIINTVSITQKEDRELASNRYHALELKILETKLALLEAQKLSEDRIARVVNEGLKSMEVRFVSQDVYDEVIETLEANIDEGRNERKELKNAQHTVRIHIAQTASALGAVVAILGADKIDLLQRLINLFKE